MAPFVGKEMLTLLGVSHFLGRVDVVSPSAVSASTVPAGEDEPKTKRGRHAMLASSKRCVDLFVPRLACCCHPLPYFDLNSGNWCLQEAYLDQIGDHALADSLL
jgi:hypothetical protein